MCTKPNLFPILGYSLICFCSLKLIEGFILIEYDDKFKGFPSELWSLGADLSIFGIEGVIVNADPLDACLPISKPPNVSDALNWFVLIDGSSCNYNTKISYSQLAGYAIAIIYKSKGNNTDTFKNYIRKHEISKLECLDTLPAVIIDESTAHTFQENFLYSVNQSVRVFVYMDEFVEKIIMITCVALLIIGVCIKCAKPCMGQFSGFFRKIKSHLNRRGISLYKKGYHETCAICLEDFKMNETLRILTCSHSYHKECIDTWLFQHQQTFCPMCKETFQSLNEVKATETTPLLNGT